MIRPHLTPCDNTFTFLPLLPTRLRPPRLLRLLLPLHTTLNGEDAIVSIPITVDDALNAHADSP